ncbi:hypothetical protein EXU85_30035 [Spirosoma sp. KCTC 42546]|uniref:hypothetical protein n=1 Tax=Spirosoma sp. KCTC 42546 TaxID=2520506 RepID=UPI00115A6C0D|nr:hypothetical protein [Spirosoma sp. KCTC 42546]QDK82620.1 hypothetical protein EXU85_30035 [Spirosoma sp. KCTC 42546]
MMTTLDEKNAKAPTHGVYFVKDRKGNPDWIRVGSAWINRDGEGMNLSLDNLGQTVILTVRPTKPKAE